MSVGETSEKRAELFPLRIGQGAAQLVLMLAGDAPDRLERLASPGRQEKSVRTAVGRMGAALDQAASLELIDELHELARLYGERGGERPLALPFRGPDSSEEAGMRWGQPQGGDPLCERGGGVRTDLRQEKCNGIRAGAVSCLRPAVGVPDQREPHYNNRK